MWRAILLGGALLGALPALHTVSAVGADSEAAATALVAQRESACDPALLGPEPEGIPGWDPQSPYETVYSWMGKRSEVPLGIGHVPDADRFWWDGRPLRLPLYSEPGGSAWGWFADGWLIETGPDAAAPRAIGVQGSVETAYEKASFIVLEARADGWLRFRYGRPSTDAKRDGLAWLHRCHLARQELTFERWEDRFMRFLTGEISPLFFRHDQPQELRERPSDESRRVRWIANDHHLEPLAFKGDWMQVIVKQPSDYCAGPDELATSSHQGWVRWRSPGLGPRVWYHTRGC